MSWLQIIVLGIIQGITEFIPVSSSAHLILLPKITGWPDQGIELDVAAHMGTLLAILVYFRHDVRRLWGEFWCLFVTPSRSRLLICLIVACVPAVAAGFIFGNMVGAAGRSVIVIGWSSIIFAGVMYLADRWGSTRLTVNDITVKRALLIGLAQAFAVIPGASRSGTTVTMGRFLGMDRAQAFRFSFLLSIPVIAGAGFFTALKAFKSDVTWPVSFVLAEIALSFIVGMMVIHLVMLWINRVHLTPFVYYRVILGVVLLIWGYGYLPFANF